MQTRNFHRTLKSNVTRLCMAGRTIERKKKKLSWNGTKIRRGAKARTLEVDLFSQGTARGVNRARIEVQLRPAV